MKLAKIIQRGDKWLVTTEDGSEVLGTHSTHAAATKQLQAIEINKHRRGATDQACMGGCDEPGTADNPVERYVTDIGTVIYRHKNCQANELRGASKKIAINSTLVCPECGNMVDPGDENETDPWQVVGDICLECGQGKMKPVTGSLRPSSYVVASPKINPANLGNDGKTTVNKQNATDHFTPQAPMTSEEGNLTENNNAEIQREPSSAFHTI